jgi:hypothetical protein
VNPGVDPPKSPLKRGTSTLFGSVPPFSRGARGDLNKVCDLLRIAIYSSGYPLIASAVVDPVVMQQILNDIGEGHYDGASAGIEQIWRYLPRR